MAKAFENIRVLDLSDRLSGAWAARLFGNFGADVILVEDERGHPLRHEPPFLNDEPGIENSLLHAYANSNKRSVRADDSELRDLIETSEVVVTSSIDLPDELEFLPSSSIHLSITPHGLDGPIAHLPGNNLTACAKSGWCAINQCIDHEPLQLPHNQSGYISGLLDLLVLQLLCFAVCELVRESLSTSARTKPWRTPVLHGQKWDCS